MKALFLVILLLGSVSARAKDLIVLADIAFLPQADYANMPKDPECDKPDASGRVVVCVGGWGRFRLTGVSQLNGAHFADTIALIYADPVLGGRWRLVLQRLNDEALARALQSGCGGSRECVEPMRRR
jgi:hypothetical protein